MSILEHTMWFSYLTVGVFYLVRILTALRDIFGRAWVLFEQTPVLINHPFTTLILGRLGYAVDENPDSINVLKWLQNYDASDDMIGVWWVKTPYGRILVWRQWQVDKDGDTDLRAYTLSPRQHLVKLHAYYDLCAQALYGEAFDRVSVTYFDESGMRNRKDVIVSSQMDFQTPLHELALSCQQFVSKRDVYLKRNVLWKRSFGLYGKPGGGKTHFIYHLAARFGSDVVFLKPTLTSVHEAFDERESDDIADPKTLVLPHQDEAKKLLADPVAVRAYIDSDECYVPSPVIYVFDDVDHDLRGRKSLKGQDVPPEKLLLEVLDGIRSVPGIFILTMNDRSVLDDYSDALLRPGRCDTLVEVGPIDDRMAEGLLKMYFPEASLSGAERTRVKEAFKGKMVARVTAELGIVESVDELKAIIYKWEQDGLPDLPDDDDFDYDDDDFEEGDDVQYEDDGEDEVDD